MTWVRNDISRVPPQGAEVATQCPVRAQWDVLQPAAPIEPSALERRRATAANEAVAELLDELTRRAPGAVVVAADRAPAERERCTLAAMAEGAAVIVGGRLPVDTAMRRVAEVDALVADPGGGYHPVVATRRSTLDERRGVAGRTACLERPSVSSSDELDGRIARKSKRDLLRLAHQWRSLEACGHAAATAWGGVLGAERAVTWHDLGAPVWRTPSRSEGTKLRSIIELYDFEFAFRLDIIAIAERRLDDPDTELLVVPVRTGECNGCPWQEHCRALMIDANDVSLLPYASWRMWSQHRARGVHTIDDLAALDRATATLLDAKVDLVQLRADVAGADGTAALTDLFEPTSPWLEPLAGAGMTTVDDLRSLDPRVVAYADDAPRNFAESIDLARARRSAAPAHLRRGVDRIDVPRADVEVDLDLENDDDGVYLWGALVTDRSRNGLVTEGYRSFATWDPRPSTDEVEVFEQLARWLSRLRTDVHTAGRTLAVYCYNERAEAGALERLAGAAPERHWVDWVDELVGSDDWVDLFAVARGHLITGAGMGLKHLATIAGFAWEDEDPGGLQSMQWHHLATSDDDPGVREANRRRILTYNRNDVEATLALRDWMEREGPTLPTVDSLEPLLRH